MAAPPKDPSPALAPCTRCGRAYPAEVLACPQCGVALPLEGRLLDGKFSLDRKIGDGGMASVWQATNVRVARTVAIKLMHARYASDPELLARFCNEAAAAGKIDSEHICDVLDFGESPIGPYIVMELLDGCSLAELIAQHRRLDPGLAVWLVRQALVGLAAAHRAGIIHRDLKPENIHLCRAIRGQWTVKLMDFGISKFSQDPQTVAGATLGTPHYMAPEQIQGAARVDARADLWSIGVILYEAITGVQLFVRDNVAASLVALRTHEPPPLSQHVPNAPRGLSEVVARCLVRPLERRIPTAEALAEALAPFERIGPKSAETVTKAATERRLAGNPKALAPGGPAKPQQPMPARGGQPATAKPAQAQPAKSVQVQPATAKSVQVQPATAKPAPAQPMRAPQPAPVQPAQLVRAPVQPSQPIARATVPPMASPVRPVAPASPAAAPSGRGLPQPGLLDRSPTGSTPRAGRLPQPTSQRTASVPAVQRTGPAPVVATSAPDMMPTIPRPMKPPAADVQPARPVAVKRGAPAPRRGVAATPANQAVLWAVLIGVFAGGLALVVVLALR